MPHAALDLPAGLFMTDQKPTGVVGQLTRRQGGPRVKRDQRAGHGQPVVRVGFLQNLESLRLPRRRRGGARLQNDFALVEQLFQEFCERRHNEAGQRKCWYRDQWAF